MVRRARTLHPAGYDVVLDGIGGPGVGASHSLVKRGGTLVVSGLQAGAHAGGGATGTLARTGLLTLDPCRRTRFYAIMRHARAHPENLTRDIAAMLAGVATGALHPVIDSILPLTEIARAHARLEGGHAQGKIVLSIG